MIHVRHGSFKWFYKEDNCSCIWQLTTLGESSFEEWSKVHLLPERLVKVNTVITITKCLPFHPQKHKSLAISFPSWQDVMFNYRPVWSTLWLLFTCGEWKRTSVLWSGGSFFSALLIGGETWTGCSRVIRAEQHPTTIRRVNFLGLSVGLIKGRKPWQ